MSRIFTSFFPVLAFLALVAFNAPGFAQPVVKPPFALPDVLAVQQSYASKAALVFSCLNQENLDVSPVRGFGVRFDEVLKTNFQGRVMAMGVEIHEKHVHKVKGNGKENEIYRLWVRAKVNDKACHPFTSLWFDQENLFKSLAIGNVYSVGVLPRDKGFPIHWAVLPEGKFNARPSLSGDYNLLSITLISVKQPDPKKKK